MTTLRRALPGLYRRESILALATLVTLAMLFAGQPALAMSHGGGGGGGHSGGGGGHASGGSHSGGAHMSSRGPSVGSGMAHPIGGGRFFGPSRGFGGGFGGGGRFFGRDRFFGGGFFPFGFGLGLGLGFAWDYPWGWGPGFYGYWGPSWYGYNPGYYPGYGYGGYGNDGYGDGYSPGYGAPGPRSRGERGERGEMGALDVAISPSDAEVYLNGEYIGRARDYSGWGRGYLWLEKGTYDIVFYKDGYRTLARQVSIYPGLVIKWDDKLEHGQAVRPEDLGTKSHERRDSRLQFERDRAEQLDRQQQMQEPPPYQGQQGQAPENNGGWNDNWRDRVNRDRGDRNDNGAAPQRNVQPAPAPGPARAAVTSDQYGRLRIKVEPDDASVYLDGRFVGTGSDLAGNEAGLLLSPGHHRVSVVRPGHRAEERDLDAVLGKDIDLTVTLTPSSPTGK
ncbi:MAG TPA: PEGA domain-containing protein [Thermoanaerobaculia bacterium]